MHGTRDVRGATARSWVACACLLLVAACGRGSDDVDGDVAGQGAPSPGVPVSPSAAASGTAEPVDVQAAGGQRFLGVSVDWLQVVDGVPWAAASGSLVRLDPTTGRSTATVDTPADADSCTAMEQHGGVLFAAICSSPGQVVQVDARTARITRTFRLPGHEVQEEGSVGVDPDHVWVVTAGSPRLLLGIDRRTGRVDRRLRVHPGVVGVRAGLGGLWATDPDRGELLRLDPRSGRVLATIPTGAGARFFAIGEGSVWVLNNTDSSVTRVDPATNQAVATIDVSTFAVDGGDLAVGGGAVWARISDVLVARIDPATNTVAARYGPSSGSGSVAADDSAVWISAHDSSAIYRLALP